jgi:NAD(P)-dependent dehydrogenase (short-subunit alcohol dehydrogenase family)
MPDASNMFSLEGKTAVVTGTSAGLGKGLARTLVMAGARVAGIARRRTELDEEAASTGRLLSITADLAEPDQVRSAAGACLDALGGRVDILVNNAAWQAAGVKAEDESYEEIRRTFAINVETPILLAQAFFPGMRRRGAARSSTSRQPRRQSVSAAFPRRRTRRPRAGWRRSPGNGRRSGAGMASGSTAWPRASSRRSSPRR